MRRIQLAKDVVSVGDLKVSASRLLRRLREERRPIVITQHGRPAGVLVSPADFDMMTEQARFLEAVQAGLDDAAAGRVLDDEALAGDLDVELARREEK